MTSGLQRGRASPPAPQVTPPGHQPPPCSVPAWSSGRSTGRSCRAGCWVRWTAPRSADSLQAGAGAAAAHPSQARTGGRALAVAGTLNGWRGGARTARRRQLTRSRGGRRGPRATAAQRRWLPSGARRPRLASRHRSAPACRCLARGEAGAGTAAASQAQQQRQRHVGQRSQGHRCSPAAALRALLRVLLDGGGRPAPAAAARTWGAGVAVGAVADAGRLCDEQAAGGGALRVVQRCVGLRHLVERPAPRDRRVHYPVRQLQAAGQGVGGEERRGGGGAVAARAGRAGGGRRRGVGQPFPPPVCTRPMISFARCLTSCRLLEARLLSGHVRHGDHWAGLPWAVWPNPFKQQALVTHAAGVTVIVYQTHSGLLCFSCCSLLATMECSRKIRPIEISCCRALKAR